MQPSGSRTGIGTVSLTKKTAYAIIAPRCKMKKAGFVLLMALLSATVFSAPKADDFSRGIVYYLIDDIELANKYLDAYFRINPRPSVKTGFSLLMKNEKWEATKIFSYYLESDHRSLEALTGVSLAVADMKNSLSIDNLFKIVRMNAEYAPAYLCLGNEYLKRRNYPAAEANFNKAIKFSKIPEYKLLLCEQYLQTGQPQAALDLIQPEAELAPANYYFSLLTARAFYQLGNWAELSTYIGRALKVKPASKEGQLLLAQYYMKIDELKKARKILEKLKFDYYNLEYGLTFAEVLTKLKDSDAEKYLYEVFSQNQWEPRINLLLGLYNFKKKNPNVQNWINRAILSGKGGEELKREFPGTFDFPSYPSLPFFDVKKIQWLNSSLVLLAGNLQSGEKEKMLLVDTVTQKIIKSFEYEGAIQEMFASKNLEKIVFSTTAVDNEKVYIYTLFAAGGGYSLQPVVGYALKMPSIIVAFNAQASEVYITDGSLAEQAFVSPFSTLSAYGRKIAVYPNFPFQVYRYTYAGERWAEIKDRELLRRVPIGRVQQYLAVADAAENNKDVGKLIDKGRNIDITSSEEVKIFFGDDPDRFIIYFSDLKNAFQGLVYDRESNRTTPFDESMFLGEKYYSELDILSFNPQKNEILFMTKDKEKNLFLVNYHSLLYKKLGNGILAACVNQGMDTIYFLSERNKFLYFSEANLEIVRLAPFAKEKISSRRDLNSIVDCSSPNEQYFSTFNGEMLKLDETGNFVNCQVALAGAVFQPSPDKGKVVAFINGRVFVLPWLK
jgi:tetratricopeptide (TPR) repeat protein